MDNDERRKVKELMKEKGKDDVPLQWMYRENKPDDEDFLLGKRIDKIGEEEDKKEDMYGAVFSERIQHNIQMDAQSKMREDPLFAIRQKEEDAKRRLLENPVKMKRLQQAIDRQKESKNKKSKKKKHKREDSDSDSDDDLMSKYLDILNAKHKGTKSSSCREDKYSDRKKQRNRSPQGREETHGRDKGRAFGREKEKGGEKYGRRDDDKRGRNEVHDDDRHSDRYKPDRKSYRDNKNRPSRSQGDRRLESEGYRGSDRCLESEGFRGSDRRLESEGYRGSDRYRNERHTGYGKNQYKPDKTVSSESDVETGRRYNKHEKRDKSRKTKYLDSAESEQESDIRGKGVITADNKTRGMVKRSRHDSSSSSSSSSSDIERRKNVKGYNRKADADVVKCNRQNISSSSSSSSVSDIRSSVRETKNGRKNTDNSSRKIHDSSLSSDSEEACNAGRKRMNSGSDSDNERKLKPKSYGLVILNPENAPSPRSHKARRKNRSSSRSLSPPKKFAVKKRSKSRSPPRQPKRKLTAEEKQKRLAEMMDNAKWRDEQRKTNVKRYANEDKMEQDDQQKNYEKTGSSEFVNPMMSLHAENSSVEDRIKRNRHNILRTAADMDRGFSKK